MTRRTAGVGQGRSCLGEFRLAEMTGRIAWREKPPVSSGPRKSTRYSPLLEPLEDRICLSVTQEIEGINPQVIPPNNPGDHVYEIDGSFGYDAYWGSADVDDDYYQVTLMKGAPVTVSITSGSAEVAVDIGGQTDGGHPFYGDAGGNGVITEFTPSATDAYYFFLRSERTGPYTLTITINPVTDIAPTLAWNTQDGGVDFGYTVSGAALTANTTAALYWANGENLASVLGDPIFTESVPDKQAVGSYVHPIDPATLGTPPDGATNLLAVADPPSDGKPIGEIDETNESNNVVALPLPQPDIAATSLMWADDGGVDFSYTVSGADLPQATTVALYWAGGTTFDTAIGPPVFTVTVATTRGTYGPTHVASAALGKPPEGSNYLLAVADPANTLAESDETNNVVAAPIPVDTIDTSVKLISSLDSADMGVNYTISAVFTNNGSQPLVDGTLSWAEFFPASPSFRGLPDTGELTNIFVAPHATATVPLKTEGFSRRFEWIPSQNPVSTLSDTLKNMLFPLGSLNLKLLIGNTSQFADLAKTLSDLVKKLGGPGSKLSATVSYKGDLTSGSQTVGAEAANVEITVPLLKELEYLSYQSSSFLAASASEAGAIALALGALQPAAAFITGELVGLETAKAFYTLAADPPDPNYQVVATPQLLSVPEVDALPDGPWKEYGQDELMFMALTTAEATSLNRADGAAAAGDDGWQSTQLLAASGYAATAADLETRLKALYSSLVEPYIEQTLVPHESEMVPYLTNQGLPELEVRYLTAFGWSADDVATVRQTLIDTGPSLLDSADAGPNAMAILALSSASRAEDIMNQAIQSRVDDLHQPVQQIAAQDQQALAEARDAITAGLAHGAYSDSLLGTISTYLSAVREQVDATNNLPALQDDLDFGLEALSGLQQLPTSPPPASNNPPVFNPIADTSIAEGSTLSFTATATDTDPGQTHYYSLDPGAPAGAQIDPASGVFNWTPIAPGNYSLTVRVTDNSSPPLSDAQTFTITVNDIAPTVTLGANVSIRQGTRFLRNGSFSTPTSGTFKGAVDYGDGTGLQPLIVSPSETLSLSHTYARSGAFTVTVDVMDTFGLVGTQTISVMVAPALFVSGFGAGRDAFVVTLYREDLGRLPEPSGFRFWSRTLAWGVKPPTVARAIWRSREHRTLQRLHLAPSMSFPRSFSNAMKAGSQAAYQRRFHLHPADSMSRSLGTYPFGKRSNEE
jgi:Putative Ig domain/PKD domain